MDYHFRNLIFEGGGVKGMAYAGALAVLADKGILPSITRVGGSSAGAIIAVLVGLGYSVEDIRSILREMDFNLFLDASSRRFRNIHRLFKKFGWYKGDFFRNWIAQIIGRKTGNKEATFRDVYTQKAAKRFLDIYLTGTNLSTGFSEVFSYEHTPDFKIADAARISMSIPLFFTAIQQTGGDVYVDGGVLINYPIKLFDRVHYVEKYCRSTDYYKKQNNQLLQHTDDFSPFVYNKETLGFRLDSAKEIAVFHDPSQMEHKPIRHFREYIFNLIGAYMESQQNQHLHSDDWQRTIYIDTLDVRTTDFHLPDSRKDALILSGSIHTKQYFEWYDHKATLPFNSPKTDNISLSAMKDSQQAAYPPKDKNV